MGTPVTTHFVNPFQEVHPRFYLLVPVASDPSEGFLFVFLVDINTCFLNCSLNTHNLRPLGASVSLSQKWG